MSSHYQSCRIPDYIQLQFISTHIANELANISPALLPDALRWRKITYLANQGYLGRYPGYFLDGSIRNEEYLNKLLNMEVLAQEEEMFDSNNLSMAGGFNNNFSISNSINNASNNKNNNKNNNINNNNNYNYTNSTNDNTISNLKDNIDGGYYIDGQINWNSKIINDEIGIGQFHEKDLSLPCKFDVPNKTDIKFTLSPDELTINTSLIENTMFNLYPRGNNKGNVFTISLDSYITPLLCIYYYEIDIINGIENESDIVIGFIKEEIRNITNTSTSMIDMRGTDDRAIGWYGKNGYLTIWNEKRIEKFTCKFGNGDTVGIGYNLYKDTFFITKNGLFICEIGSLDIFLEKSFEGKKNVRGLVPSISLGSWSGIKLNLGNQRNFKFDIENYVKDNKVDFINHIKTSKFEKFNLIGQKSIENDNDLTNYVDSLVLGYLKYGGYADTIKEMERDLKDLKRQIIKPKKHSSNNNNNNNKTLLELCNLKKRIKQLIKNNKFLEAQKVLDLEYPGFFTTYRKINFRLRIVRIIHMLVYEGKSVLECLKLTSQLKHLFKEDDCQYYIDRISILFSYEDPTKCINFKHFFNENKIKIIYAIIMAINEQNHLPFISSLDLIILRTDQNLESYINDLKDNNNNKGLLLINMLEDYIKF